MASARDRAALRKSGAEAGAGLAKGYEESFRRQFPRASVTQAYRRQFRRAADAGLRRMLGETAPPIRFSEAPIEYVQWLADGGPLASRTTALSNYAVGPGERDLVVTRFSGMIVDQAARYLATQECQRRLQEEYGQPVGVLSTSSDAPRPDTTDPRMPRKWLTKGRPPRQGNTGRDEELNELAQQVYAEEDRIRRFLGIDALDSGEASGLRLRLQGARGLLDEARRDLHQYRARVARTGLGDPDTEARLLRQLAEVERGLGQIRQMLPRSEVEVIGGNIMVEGRSARDAKGAYNQVLRTQGELEDALAGLPAGERKYRERQMIDAWQRWSELDLMVQRAKSHEEVKELEYLIVRAFGPRGGTGGVTHDRAVDELWRELGRKAMEVRAFEAAGFTPAEAEGGRYGDEVRGRRMPEHAVLDRLAELYRQGVLSLEELAKPQDSGYMSDDVGTEQFQRPEFERPDIPIPPQVEDAWGRVVEQSRATLAADLRGEAATPVSGLPPPPAPQTTPEEHGSWENGERPPPWARPRSQQT